MFEIDKQKFGVFVAMLRKEKGLTQKELAKLLYISDKAVSKWETGVSIPDTALLVPMADLFGITVTELLMCQRMGQDGTMDTDQVENVVKTAISYSNDKPVRAFQVRGKWGRIYLFAFLISGLECFLCALFGAITIGLPLVALLGMIFGGYFCFFAVVRLPDYYDENRISFYNDSGIFNISFPGLAFNNNNWPHILKAGRIWAVTAMVGYPAISFMLCFLFPGAWWVEVVVEMVFIFGGTFVPMYVAGKKYEKEQDN